MQNILDLVMSNQLYMIIAGIVVLGILFFLLKKVFKLFMMIIGVVILYGVYLYMTEDDPMKVFKEKFDSGKDAYEQIDDATRDIRRDAIDKVIDDVDKKLQERAKKK